MYYKDYLLIIRRDDLCSLQECLVVEIKSGGQSCFFTCLYRSPSQNQDQFELFCGDLDLLCLSNINDLNPDTALYQEVTSMLDLPNGRHLILLILQKDTKLNP